MSENKAEQLEKFVGFMNDAQAVGAALDRMKDSRTDEQNKGQKDIKRLGYEWAKKSLPDFSANEDAVPDKQLMEYAQARAQFAIQDASNLLSSGLEQILGGLEGKKLETLGNVKEVAEAAGDKYAAWRQAYDAVQGTRDLAARAKKGQVKKEEREVLLAGTAQTLADKAKKKFGEKYSSALAHLAAQLTADAVMRGFAGANALNEGADRLVKDTEKALKDYEEKSKQSLKEYVGEGMKKLVKGSRAQFERARDILYSVAK